ncbi:putative phage abortive infection protein [Fibrobacter sp. UBA4297]|uniref:putative phage abortive infection protein n=1 Tax=Fibrobacter sp. UBA4297 TaxID=1946536 RepID=UPI0025C022BD|nr:putative phage abortive infection protein [Fibrobacter sp. UBA4297]
MKFAHKKPIGISVFLGIVIAFALSSPLIFTKIPALISFPEYAGGIGTVFSIMSPFIAIAAVIATFAAFWIQYNANQEMLRNNEKMQIERQFYEMLKIHEENTKYLGMKKWMMSGIENKISTSITDRISSSLGPKYDLVELKGHDATEFYLKEFEVIDLLLEYFAEKYQKEQYVKLAKVSRKDWLKRVYRIFYYGIEAVKWKDSHYNEKLYEYQYKNMVNVQQMCSSIHPYQVEKELKDIYTPVMGTIILDGHSSQMNHYYRHLYLLVKYVVNIDDDLYGSSEDAYSAKRNYLRILRAQLSNTEQLLLFYNWLSNHGQKWECIENHFFSDYRMIHNIWPNGRNRYNQVSLRTLFPEHIKGDGPMFEFEEQ